MTNEYLVPIKPAKPIENTIRFFNTMSGDNVEVLRISKDGITANADVPVDEAAQAVLRAVDGYIKQLTQRTWVGLTDEDVVGLCREFMGQFDKTEFIKATETKLKEKNT